MTKPYILATDDEAINQMVLEEILDNDYELHCVDNGIECLESAKNRRPDLILMDINMPIMNGIESCKAVRALDGCADLPIIMVSSSASENDIKKGLSSGANAYITKPFVEEELVAIIKQYLGK